MRMDEWRALLNVDARKSKGEDDYWAICPCHDDHEASLHVSVAPDGGIRMKCFVCDAGNVEVAQALGKTAADVMVVARTGEDMGRGRTGRTDRPRERKKAARKPTGEWKLGDVWHMGKKREPYTITAIYDFKGPDGETVMQKARLETQREDGTRAKSFAFRSFDARDGRWYSDHGIYGDILYRWETIAARGAGEPVYVVEGEKDADNLAALGFCAVSGAYGAGRGDRLEGKWLESYTRALAGAELVVLIPDNDGAGEALMQYAARQLDGKVGELRMLRPAEHMDGLDIDFVKGDITDYCKALRAAGLTRGGITARIRAITAQTPAWTRADKRTFERPAREDGEADNPHSARAATDEGKDEGEPYHDIAGYSVKWGRLCRIDPKYGAEAICDFVPEPRAVITRDDGATTATEYVIAGTAWDGRTLPEARVQAEEMDAMRWPGKAWAFAGNVRPKRNAREYVRDAIMRAGQRIASARTIYGHTGMREIGGRPCYLYNGGAIGAEGVSVELVNNLQYYDLTAPEGVTAREGAEALMRLYNTMPLHIIAPLLAQAYLAPVYSAMERLQNPPSYVVYVVGRSGSYKSTLVGYIESMFGHFYVRRHTATFQDTAAGVRDRAFLAKDALFVVDDYNPETSAGRRAAMDALAQAIITTIADGAGRSGLTAQHQQAASKPARCTCIMTGEQLPTLNQGRMLRLYVIEVAPGEIAGQASELEPFRRDSAAGRYRAAMRSYIEGLLARHEGLGRELARRMDEARAIIARDEDMPREYARMQDACEHLLCGCGLFVDDMIRLGAVEADMREAMMGSMWAALRENLMAQGEEIKANDPVRIYIEALRALIRMGTVRIAEIDPTKGAGAYYGPGMIGYKDTRYYYIQKEAADRAVRTMLREQGRDMGTNANVLCRMLLEQRVVYGDGKNPCRSKSIGGRVQRYLWIPVATIDGAKEPPPPPQPAQARMEDYKPTDEPSPFDKTST